MLVLNQHMGSKIGCPKKNTMVTIWLFDIAMENHHFWQVDHL